MEEIIFYIGIGLFSFTSLVFLFLKKKNHEIAALNMIVNFITIASYILMVSELGVITALSGDFIYWTRWAFYAVSCSFLMYEISKILNIDIKTTLEIIVFNSIVMLTGLFASITQVPVKWLFFTLSALAYIYILYHIGKNRTEQKFIFLFVVVFWSGFPLIWLLSPAAFMVLNSFWTALIYLVLDLITKVYFGVYTTLKFA
ncbi:MAG: bacteriorhodopsin [Promethearchaeota archaeon]|nr:MAG: bacteriorhodopsin [Candidatus Lokiarchaeota archaeon]